MARFSIPRDIYYGSGTLATLSKLNGQRALLVLGKDAMKRLEFVQKADTYLKGSGMNVRHFEGVEPNPSIETVLKGAKALREFSPDWIVALGGGSVIDAAKAMWVFYEYPDMSFETLTKQHGLPELRKKAKFVAISTTSGSGSEVSAFCVIADNAVGTKYPLVDYSLVPDIAIVDAQLAQSVPPKIAAYSGMQALVNAMEAYVSRSRSMFSDPLALRASDLVLRFLPASYENDPRARERMHYAQCLAGMASTNAMGGIVHAMAHKTSVAFESGPIPHGCVSAIYLPHVIRFNGKDIAPRYAQMARALNIEAENDKALLQALAKKVEELSAQLKIPHTLKDFGVDETEFERKLDSISENTVKDPWVSKNPREVTKEQLSELFRCAYSGKTVNF